MHENKKKKQEVCLCYVQFRICYECVNEVSYCLMGIKSCLSTVLICIMFLSYSTTPVYVDDINLYQTADITSVDCSSLTGQTTTTFLSVLPRSSQVGDNKFIKLFLAHLAIGHVSFCHG